MNKLNNYFMKPAVMGNKVNVFPIKIMEYEEFKKLASNYIVLDIPQLNNKRKQDKEKELELDNLFDYLVSLIETSKSADDLINQITYIKTLSDSEIESFLSQNANLEFLIENEALLKEIAAQNHHINIVKMVQMTIKEDVEFNYKYKCFDIKDADGELLAVITKDNFYEYRSIVMEQNLLFEPLVAPTKQAQKFIDNKLKGSNKDGESSDLEAIVAFVCTNTASLDISNYTYYRLMADFYSLLKQLNRREVVSFSAAGATKKNGGALDIPSVVSKLEVTNSPYDGIFTEIKEEN